MSSTLRNENIGVVVSACVMVVGCWIADWDPSDTAAAVIVTAAFLLGYAVIAVLYERQGRPTARRDARR
jgi:hypothetical protein